MVCYGRDLSLTIVDMMTLKIEEREKKKLERRNRSCEKSETKTEDKKNADNRIWLIENVSDLTVEK